MTGMTEFDFNGVTYTIAAGGLVTVALRLRYERMNGRRPPLFHVPPDEVQVAWCVAWLAQYARPRKTKTLNTNVPSQRLQDIISRWCGEDLPGGVTNGAVIEAVHRLLPGGIVPHAPTQPNAYFRLVYKRTALQRWPWPRRRRKDGYAP
jgi:hypothetical protein